MDLAKSEEAKLLLGGAAAKRPERGKGWFVAIIRFKDEADAVRIANDTRFGLGSGVWTRDMGRAFRVSEQLQAGMVRS